MFKLDSESNKDVILNSRVKSQLKEKDLRKIEKTLLFITEMDIKASKTYNVIVIKKDENENKMARPTIIPQRNNHEAFEEIKQKELKTVSDIKIENEINSDLSELADSSDFENESND